MAPLDEAVRIGKAPSVCAPTPTGNQVASFTSLPFGDAQTQTTYNGGDWDANHFAQLDFDSESDTDHAQYRQYSPTEGRWMRPDSYAGSYNLGNPQSMNRYTYAMNSPLRYIDPSGRDACAYDNGDGTATIFNAEDGGGIDCPGNGIYITTDQQVTAIGLDANGDLAVYGTSSDNLYAPDGSPYSVSQSVTVSADGSSSISTASPFYSPSQQYISTVPTSNLDPDSARILTLAVQISNKEHCATQSLVNAAPGMAVDAAGSIPGEGPAVLLTKVAAGSVGTAVSGATNDNTGAALNAASVPVNAAAAADVGKGIPVVANFFSLASVGRDIWNASGAYAACF